MRPVGASVTVSLLLLFGPTLPDMVREERGTAESSAHFLAEVRLTTPFVVARANCGDCKCCFLSCGKHKAPLESGENADVQNPHSDCLDFAGCDGHPDCAASNESLVSGPDRGRLETLLQRVLSGDVEAVGKILRDYSHLAEFNSARQALQIQGCGREVIAAHLPLSADQVKVVD